jgi:hypothetical protein
VRGTARPSSASRRVRTRPMAGDHAALGRVDRSRGHEDRGGASRSALGPRKPDSPFRMSAMYPEGLTYVRNGLSQICPVTTSGLRRTLSQHRGTWT